MLPSFFQAIDLFSSASADSLDFLSQHISHSFYKKGSLVLNPVQAATTFLYIIRGWAKLCKESAEGEEIIIDVLSHHQYCGELFLFDSQAKEIYTVFSISEMEVFTLPLPLLKKLVVIDHPLSLTFLQAALQKQHDVNMEVEHLSIQNAVQRLGCFLLRLCDQEHTCGSIFLQLPYNKVLLASRLGMRAETFSRALASLSKQCDIRLHNEAIEISDLRKLAQYVCQHCSKTFPCKPSRSF